MMHKRIFAIAFSMLLVVICLTACGSESESSEEGAGATESVTYYELNSNINTFISNYNSTSPEVAITTDMLERHNRDDVVLIKLDEGWEVSIKDMPNYIELFVRPLGAESEADDFLKQSFLTLGKGFDPTLSTSDLENYWNKAIDNLGLTTEIEPYTIKIYGSNGHPEYYSFQIENTFDSFGEQ